MNYGHHGAAMCQCEMSKNVVNNLFNKIATNNHAIVNVVSKRYCLFQIIFDFATYS